MITRSYPAGERVGDLPSDVQCGADLLRHLRERTFHLQSTLRANPRVKRRKGEGAPSLSNVPPTAPPAKNNNLQFRVKKMKTKAEGRARTYELRENRVSMGFGDAGTAGWHPPPLLPENRVEPPGAALPSPPEIDDTTDAPPPEADKGALVMKDPGPQLAVPPGALVPVGHYHTAPVHDPRVGTPSTAGIMTPGLYSNMLLERGHTPNTDRSNWLVALDSRPCSKATQRDQALASTFTSTLSSALSAHLVPAEPLQPALGAWPKKASLTSVNLNLHEQRLQTPGAGAGRGGKGKASKSTKPALLEKLEKYMYGELGVAHNDDARLRVYQEVFQCFVESFASYRPLLSEVKEAYDDRVGYCARLQEHAERLEAALASAQEEEASRIEAIERRVLEKEAQADQRVAEYAAKYEALWGAHEAVTAERNELKAAVEKAEKGEAAAIKEKKRFGNAIDKMCEMNNVLKAEMHKAEVYVDRVNDVWKMKENSLLYALEKLGEFKHIQEYKNMKWNLFGEEENEESEYSSPPHTPSGLPARPPQLFEPDLQPFDHSVIEFDVSVSIAPPKKPPLSPPHTEGDGAVT